jgi:DivIVA domain-containing protein
VSAATIRNVTFRMAMRGYAVAEVDAFLDEVEQELTRLSSQASSAPNHEPPVIATGDQPHDDQPVAQAVSMLTLADQTARRAVRDAEAEAAEIVAAARAEARAARHRCEALRGEIARLSDVDRHHRARMVDRLHEQLDLVQKAPALQVIPQTAI